jgi:hypothetical protein
LEGASIASEKIWTFEDLQPKTDTKNGSQKMGKETWREEKSCKEGNGE